MRGIDGVGGGLRPDLRRTDSLGDARQRFGDVLRNTLGDAGSPSAQAAGLMDVGPQSTAGMVASAESGAARRAAPVERSGSAGRSRGADSSVAALADSLTGAVQSRLAQVQDSENEATASKETLLNGGDIEIHNVMLATQKAKLELQLTMQLRNKLIEAYQEVMRTPV
jgi:flagellar hook-basal body complex protein FliE